MEAVMSRYRVLSVILVAVVGLAGSYSVGRASVMTAAHAAPTTVQSSMVGFRNSVDSYSEGYVAGVAAGKRAASVDTRRADEARADDRQAALDAAAAAQAAANTAAGIADGQVFDSRGRFNEQAANDAAAARAAANAADIAVGAAMNSR